MVVGRRHVVKHMRRFPGGWVPIPSPPGRKKTHVAGHRKWSSPTSIAVLSTAHFCALLNALQLMKPKSCWFQLSDLSKKKSNNCILGKVFLQKPRQYLNRSCLPGQRSLEYSSSHWGYTKCTLLWVQETWLPKADTSDGVSEGPLRTHSYYTWLAQYCTVPVFPHGVTQLQEETWDAFSSDPG